MDQKFMKEKKILPLVLAMSYPMMLSMAVGALYNIIDSFYVAQLDGKAMTALSLLFPIQNLAHSVVVGFAIGINSVVSFFLGAQKQKKADEATTTGFVLSICHGLLMSVICIAIMPYFLRMFTSDEVTISYGLQYSGMVFLFCGIDAAGVAFEKIFQAVGRMKASMFSMMAGCVANIILDPLLIFGIGPFPEMGIRGAALATGLGQVLALGVYLAIYFAQPIPVKLRKDSVKIEKSLLKQLYSIGSAATLNMALPSLQISVLNGILAGFSDSYVFVLGVYYKLQTFLYLSANGIIQGIRPLIGYNYGAGEMKRVQKIYTISMGLIAAIMTVGTILCVLLPQQMIHLFSSDPQVITMGGEALQIISMGFIVSTVSVTTSGALEGLGKGTPSLVISLIRYILFILPVAFLLSKIFGAAGVWHAFWITEIFAAMVSVMVYWKAVHGGKRFSLGKFL